MAESTVLFTWLSFLTITIFSDMSVPHLWTLGCHLRVKCYQWIHDLVECLHRLATPFIFDDFHLKFTSPHLEEKRRHWAFSLKRIFGQLDFVSENLHVFFWGQAIESWGPTEEYIVYHMAYRLDTGPSGSQVWTDAEAGDQGQKDITCELNNVVRIMSRTWYCSRCFSEMLHWGDLVITLVTWHPCQMHWHIQ